MELTQRIVHVDLNWSSLRNAYLRCAPRAEPPGVLRVEAAIRYGSAEGGAR